MPAWKLACCSATCQYPVTKPPGLRRGIQGFISAVLIVQICGSTTGARGTRQMTTQAFGHKNHMDGGIKNTGQFQICSSVQSTIRRSASHEFVELSAPTCTGLRRQLPLIAHKRLDRQLHPEAAVFFSGRRRHEASPADRWLDSMPAGGSQPALALCWRAQTRDRRQRPMASG